MGNPNDAEIARLERDHPGWQVWIVYRYIGGPVWCARRWSDDDARNTLNAASAADLVQYIAEEEGKQR